MLLPADKKFALLANMDHALADKELRETGGADLTTDGYYDLVYLATGSEFEARRRAKARRAAILSEGGNPK